MPGIEDLFFRRFASFNDCSPEERSQEIARSVEKMMREEQEFIASLTAEKMQELYQQMFAGSTTERTLAMCRWSRGIQSNPRIPISIDGPASRHDAFDVLRRMADSDPDASIASCAVHAIGTIFQHALDGEVTSFLAHLVCDESRARWLRLTAYRNLWLVTQDKLRTPLSPGSPSRHLAEPESADVLRFLSDLDRHSSELQHFTKAMRKGFNLQTDIRWDWVKSFLD